MLHLHRYAWAALLALAAASAGCGKSDKAGPDAAVEGAAAPAQDALAPGAPTAADQSPDAAVRAIFDGLRHNRPEAFWHSLPPGYQRDANELVHEFAEKMDAELWNRSFATLQKTVRVLESKKEFILPQAQALLGGFAAGVPGGAVPDKEDLAQGYDAVVGLLATIVESDLSDLRKLRTIDLGDLIARTGGRLMEQLSAASRLAPEDFMRQFRDSLEHATVTVLSDDGTRATVRIEGPEVPTEDAELVKVEGRWVDARIADEWEERIGQARAAVADISAEDLAQQSQQVLTVLAMVDSVLDQLQAAETAEEFEAAVQQHLGPALMMAQMMMSGGEGLGREPSPFPAPTVDGNVVMVVVTGDLDEETTARLKTQLEDASDSPDDAFALPLPADGAIEFELDQVKDVAAFAKKIKFGKVVEVDEAGRRITVEWNATDDR